MFVFTPEEQDEAKGGGLEASLLPGERVQGFELSSDRHTD